MNKKLVKLIVRCCYIAIIIIFEIVMYFIVGETVLLHKSIIRTLWLWVPFVLMLLLILAEIIIEKTYKNKH